MERNYVLPQGNSYSAVVRGKPTGLAGCFRAHQCERSTHCLRSHERLHPFDLTPDVSVKSGCQFFISN